MQAGTPNELTLHLGRDTRLRVRVENNILRDVIILVFGAFYKEAVESESIVAAVSRGISPMLTVRTLPQENKV